MGEEQNDPVIDEVREVRHRISERVGHDPARLVAYYMELQQQYQGRLIAAPKAEAAEPPAQTDSAPMSDSSKPLARTAERGR